MKPFAIAVILGIVIVLATVIFVMHKPAELPETSHVSSPTARPSPAEPAETRSTPTAADTAAFSSGGAAATPGAISATPGAVAIKTQLAAVPPVANAPVPVLTPESKAAAEQIVNLLGAASDPPATRMAKYAQMFGSTRNHPESALLGSFHGENDDTALRESELVTGYVSISAVRIDDEIDPNSFDIEIELTSKGDQHKKQVVYKVTLRQEAGKTVIAKDEAFN